MRNWRATTAAVAAVSALALAGCSSENEQNNGGGGNGGSDLSGTLRGVGASSQQAAQEAWMAGFNQLHPDVTVDYSPDGSGAGREQFISGGSDFGGTDAYLSDDEGELQGAIDRCGEVIEVPVYVSPIAVVFNLPGIDTLNLRPGVIAQIFNQEITDWNDPAIAEDNPGVELPDLPITPVNRSDESGTTENFTEYLSVAAPDDWPHEPSGNWPVPGGESAQGTSGVVGTVQGGEGTIGYVDASQAGDLGTVAVGVGDEFVAYSPQAAAQVLAVSERVEGRGEYDFAYELARDTTEEGVYPIVLVSYAMACQTYDDENTAELVRAYLSYMISPEGQQAAAEQAGSAPLSDALRQQYQTAVDAIGSSGSGS
ncbi:phosphate ABC transporter substrate-binding protein PstS [Streptomyces sp. 7-21]|uniref:phosphate ABC transporter substrate-binding protein PstS n=1 Tax=Streptomyces sp. 7-21 TaxID=2802283 RepID=UPI00191F6CC6|nr:phosphate ABC transporter substrate-binding protein PstS [Streptomyces sp. 7-21]MBL1067547.1 phosphate ABC transporter substrate-binding protein PstS [Streptomyces sp. 7-21]